MRQIKFRGKNITTGEWQYGCLVNNLWGYAPHHSLAGQAVCEIIVCDTCDDYADLQDKDLNKTVDPKTVGQFTGLTDKNGKEIYEGDLVRDQHTVFEIIWRKGGFYFKRISGCYQSPYFGDNCSRMEIIGNIYSKPELLNNL